MRAMKTGRVTIQSEMGSKDLSNPWDGLSSLPLLAFGDGRMESLPNISHAAPGPLNGYLAEVFCFDIFSQDMPE